MFCPKYSSTVMEEATAAQVAQEILDHALVNKDPLDANLSPDDPHDDQKETTKIEKQTKRKRSVKFWSSFTTEPGSSSGNLFSSCAFDAAVLIISPANAILLFTVDEH
jgi:hypothetical protein